MSQPNIQQMLKQAQEMLAAQQKAQAELAEKVVEASAGGGMVKVAISGNLEVKALTIDPDAVDPDDVEMLQDLVMAAVNEALRQASELQAKALEGAGMPDFDPMAALESLGLGGAGLGGPGGLPGGMPPMNRAARRAAKKRR